MITREERRAIAERLDDMGASGAARDIVSGVLGGYTQGPISKQAVRRVQHVIRELCEDQEPLSATDEERGLAAVISACVKRAVREGDPDTAIDAIKARVDDELAYQRAQVRNDCDGCESIPVPLGRDGVPVMPDDTVYGEDGVAWRVLGIGTGVHAVCAVDEPKFGPPKRRELNPAWLTHRSDTAASLADELEAMCNGLMGDARTATRARDLRGIAERMRGLGERS